MFSMTEFLMKTIKGMIGNYPDFQVREYAANWYGKSKLTEENLAEIDVLIENQYIVPETPKDEVFEELVEELESEETAEPTEEVEPTEPSEETNEEVVEPVAEETIEEIE